MIKRKFLLLSIGLLAYYSLFLNSIEWLMNKQLVNLFLIDTILFVP